MCFLHLEWWHLSESSVLTFITPVPFCGGGLKSLVLKVIVGISKNKIKGNWFKSICFIFLAVE